MQLSAEAPARIRSANDGNEPCGSRRRDRRKQIDAVSGLQVRTPERARAAASDGCRATNRAAKLAAVARKAKSSIGPKRAVRRPFAEGISRITDLCFDLWPIRIVAKSQRGEIDAKASPMPSRGTAKNVTHCRRPRLAGHSSARWQRQRFALGRDCVNRALKVLPTPLLLHFWLGSRTGGALIDPSSETLEVASLKEDNDRRRYFAANCGSIQGGTLQIGSIEPVADPVLRRSVQGVFRAMKPDDEGIDLLRRSGGVVCVK